jgi:hypothetical protein
MRGVRRRAASAATAFAVAGAVGLLTAVADAPLAGYVSEAGVPGQPQSLVYRLSIFAIAAALVLLAGAARATVAPAAALLGLAAAFAAVSGAVPCSPGCPLPPYERSTAADLVHAGGSIAALGWCGLAMLAFAVLGKERWLRRVGWLGVVVAIPLLAASGIALLVAGRGLVTGVLERLALAAALAWLVATSALHAIRLPTVQRPPAPPPSARPDRGWR